MTPTTPPAVALFVLAGFSLAQDNILILLADDMGVDNVGVYAEGGTPPATPTIDALAQTGVLFRNAWSNPLCSPTRATIQTGRYGFRTGIGHLVTNNSQPLAFDEVTLPEMLDAGETGYAHAAFGKWHLGNDDVGGPLAANLAGYGHFVGTEENFVGAYGYYHWPKIENGFESISAQYATSDNIDEAAAWMDVAPEPWLCYIAFNAPHNPLHWPPKYLHSVDLPDVDDPRRSPNSFFRAACESMDAEILRLFTLMGDKYDRTNIFFIGDNGTPHDVTVPPFDPDHAKLTPYEGGINVPFIVSGPAVVQPGRESDALISTADVYMTVAGLAGMSSLPLQNPVDSVSLVPYLDDPDQESIRSTVFSEFFFPDLDNPTIVWRMIRDNRYKLIVRGGQQAGRELYDLQDDPFERKNLMDEPMTPDQMAAFLYLSQELVDLLATG